MEIIQIQIYEKDGRTMKRIISMVIAIAVLISIAVPVAASAASQVSNVKQTSASQKYVGVAWDTVLGASKYMLQISENEYDGYIVDSESSLSSRTIYNLSPGKTYYVKATAYINGAYDMSTTSTPIKVCTAPDKVQNFRQTNATTSSVTLTWSKTAGATSYAIYGRSNSQDYPLGTTTGTTFTIKGLSNKNSFPYDIYIRPIRKEGDFEAGGDLSYYNYASIYGGNIKLVPKKSATPKLTNVYDSIGVVYFDDPSVPFEKGTQTSIYKADKKSVYTSGAGYRFEGLKKGQFYKARRRYYTTVGDKNSTKYGAWSDYTYFALGCNAVNATSKNNSIKVSWSKVKGGNVKYDIYVSKNKDTGRKKFKANVKGTSIKVTKYGKKKLSRRTSYYVFVYPKIKVGKKTYTSPWVSYVYTSTK